MLKMTLDIPLKAVPLGKHLRLSGRKVVSRRILTCVPSCKSFFQIRVDSGAGFERVTALESNVREINSQVLEEVSHLASRPWWCTERTFRQDRIGSVIADERIAMPEKNTREIMAEAVEDANKAHSTLHVLSPSTMNKAQKADAVISTVSDKTDQFGDFLENLKSFTKLSESIGEVRSSLVREYHRLLMLSLF
jgi:hypothetical protein